MGSTARSAGPLSTFPLVRDLSPLWKTLVALGTYVAWTALTWLLEGRIRTLLRPEAVVDRLVYTVVANVLVGSLLALVLVRESVASGFVSRADLGFRSVPRTIVAVLVGGAIGVSLFLLQRPATVDPVVLGNVFAQVLPVSIAEVVVCWVVVGGTLAAFLRGRGVRRVVASGTALVVSSVLFGAYHLAHSPPFNTLQMVALLAVVGVGTGLLYFAGRSFYGALAFHNVMALIGVVSSLAAAGQLDAYRRPLVPLLVTASVALVVVVGVERAFVRDAEEGPTGASLDVVPDPRAT